MKLRSTEDACRYVAKHHSELETRVRRLAETTAQSVLRRFPYRDIFFGVPQVVDDLRDATAAEMRKLTPYDLLSCSFEVEAEDQSADEALRVAQRDIAVETERKRTEAIERARLERERKAEQERQKEELRLKKERAEAERAEAAADALSKIQIEEEAAAARNREIQDKLALAPDPLDIIAVTNPDVYVKARIAEATIQGRIQIARESKTFIQGKAEGILSGVNTALRMQNLSPETMRIAFEVPPEPDFESDLEQQNDDEGPDQTSDTRR
jgi:regulator of protease activity HflC (stomatin/prohibitin superfamily)